MVEKSSELELNESDRHTHIPILPEYLSTVSGSKGKFQKISDTFIGQSHAKIITPKQNKSNLAQLISPKSRSLPKQISEPYLSKPGTSKASDRQSSLQRFYTNEGGCLKASKGLRSSRVETSRHLTQIHTNIELSTENPFHRDYTNSSILNAKYKENSLKTTVQKHNDALLNRIKGKQRPGSSDTLQKKLDVSYNIRPMSVLNNEKDQMEGSMMNEAAIDCKMKQDLYSKNMLKTYAPVITYQKGEMYRSSQDLNRKQDKNLIQGPQRKSYMQPRAKFQKLPLTQRGKEAKKTIKLKLRPSNTSRDIKQREKQLKSQVTNKSSSNPNIRPEEVLRKLNKQSDLNLEDLIKSALHAHATFKNKPRKQILFKM